MDSVLILKETDEESVPPPQSQEEYLFLVSMVSSIADFARMDHREQDILMQNLERYECYCQLDQLLRWRAVRPDRIHAQQLSDYLWLMRVQYLGLESFENFLELVKNCVKILQISFSVIRLRILDEILGPENFRAHLQTLDIVVAELQDVSQKILALERTALICEKKLFLEGEVDGIYAKILKIAPRNEKARKFKKLQHVHNMEWVDAAEQLQILAEHAANPQERARHRHELAQLYLYNLNQVGAAMALLQPMTIQYPETRHTLIEALERLDMHEELLAALLSFERTARDADEIAQFKFKRGNGLLKLGRAEEAAKVYRDALRHQPGSLLIHEALVAALLETGALAQLGEQLVNLSQIVQLDASKETLSGLIQRIQKIVDLQAEPSQF